MAEPLREFTRFIWWIYCVEWRKTAADPQTKPDDLGCKSACTCCHSLHDPPSPFIIITQPESWYTFYCPTEGRRLSWPGVLMDSGMTPRMLCIEKIYNYDLIVTNFVHLFDFICLEKSGKESGIPEQHWSPTWLAFRSDPNCQQMSPAQLAHL